MSHWIEPWVLFLCVNERGVSQPGQGKALHIVAPTPRTPGVCVWWGKGVQKGSHRRADPYFVVGWVWPRKKHFLSPGAVNPKERQRTGVCIPEDTPNYLLPSVPEAAPAQVGGGAMNLTEEQSYKIMWSTSEEQCSSKLVTGM